MTFTNSGGDSLVKIEYVLLAVATCLIVCSCSSSVPSGQVQGVLVTEEGHPFPPNAVDVFLAAIPDETSDGMQLNTSWQSPIDDSGAFSIQDVPPGKYCIVLFDKNRATFSVVLEEDVRFVFDLPQDRGIDLGKVDASHGLSVGGT